MPVDTVHVGARIPIELFKNVKNKENNTTTAIINALELYVEQGEEFCKTSDSQLKIEELEALNQELKVNDERLIKEHDNNKVVLRLQEVQIEEKDMIIKDLQNRNETLIREITNLKNKEPDIILQEQIKSKDENQQARITDLKEQIQTLNEQINKKDNQIEDLNKTLIAQASNIYNLTQNTKLLPENNVKRWWEFWKN